MRKHVFALVVGLCLFVPLAVAHTKFLFDIDLSFDKTLKEGAIKAAQEYLNTTKEPISFDYDRELIVVKFDRQKEYSVSIYPKDFSVHGFRDDNKVQNGKPIAVDEMKRKDIAQQEFDKIPGNYKSQLLSYLPRWKSQRVKK